MNGAGKTALVVGGSMSGLLAGLMLRQDGWRVDIFERVDTELAGRGAGIVAQPELIRHIENLGLRADALGVQARTRKIFDRVGRVSLTQEREQTLTAWERIYRLLRDAFPAAHYHRGHGLATVEQDGAQVTATFSNGEKRHADLLVGADGIRSTVRAQFWPDAKPRYVGYSAWRALIAEDALPADVLREVFPYMCFGLPPGEQFLCYPVAGPDNDLRPGHRRLNVIWYRPADEATKLPWLLTDKSGKPHDISIPPPLIRPEAVQEVHDAAERLLAPPFRAIVALLGEPILQPIYDLESPHMATGRVALIGDAAFVARPHVGAGVSKAADDAAALRAALRKHDDVPAALRDFEKQRLPQNCRIIEWARHLGAYLQATQTQEERSRAGRHATDSAVIEETATLDFLYR
ncbi:MAG: FAD binding domain-containing protein [Pseudolabrys sp.]|nr:FAD binding domain-containing protein [Pseudolabrys sp.]